MRNIKDLDEIIEFTTNILENSKLDQYRKAHSKYVANLAYLRTLEKGLGKEEAKIMLISGLLHDYKKKEKKHGKKMAKYLETFFNENNIKIEKMYFDTIKDSIKYHSNDLKYSSEILDSKNKKYIKILQIADQYSKYNTLIDDDNLKEMEFIKLTEEERKIIKDENIKRFKKKFLEINE